MRSVLPLLSLSLAAVAPAVAAEVVAVPQFRSVELQGGGSLLVRPGPVQRVTLVRGSAQVTDVRVVDNGKLRIDVCRDRCPQNYRLEVVVESPSAPDVAISGGGKITAAPGFRAQGRLAAAIRGGGTIDIRAVQANQVSAAISGGGDIKVHARQSLNGAINGGGMIRYWGDPRISSAVNGGGLVRRGQ